MKFKILIILFISIVFSQKTIADIYFHNNVIYVKNIIIDDHVKFKKIIAEEKINKIVFENCYGGTPLAGYQIAKEIENKQLDTYFKGRVVSSCALAFMGGKNRYSDKTDFFYKNTLIFHAIRGKKNYTEEEIRLIIEKSNKKVEEIKEVSEFGVKKSTDFMINYINKQTNNQIPENLKEKIRQAIKNTDGIVLESKFTVVGEAKNIYYCSGSFSTVDYSYCPKIEDMTFEKLNLIHQ